MTARVRGIVGSNPVTPDAFISSKFKYKYKLKRKSKYKYKFEGKSKYKYNRKCVYMALWGLLLLRVVVRLCTKIVFIPGIISDVSRRHRSVA